MDVKHGRFVTPDGRDVWLDYILDEDGQMETLEAYHRRLVTERLERMEAKLDAILGGSPSFPVR